MKLVPFSLPWRLVKQTTRSSRSRSGFRISFPLSDTSPQFRPPLAAHPVCLSFLPCLRLRCCLSQVLWDSLVLYRFFIIVSSPRHPSPFFPRSFIRHVALHRVSRHTTHADKESFLFFFQYCSSLTRTTWLQDQTGAQTGTYKF